MKKLFAVALAAILLLAACGGGDDDGGDDTAAATPAAEETEHEAHMEFCESIVGAETAVLAAANGGDPAAAEDLLATAEGSVPPELEEQMGVVATTVREALETRDDRAFESEEFSQNEEEIDQWVADNCGYESVEVSAVDYAFEGVPETLPAGTTTFVFSNEGQELHEMLMLRLKDPSESIDDLLKLGEKEAQKHIDFISASFGPPGTTDIESKELTAGKYALVCFVPVGSTSEKAARKAQGPPHAVRGMTLEFTVE